MRRFLAISLVPLLMMGLGCSTGFRSARSTGQPSRRIDWQDPASVVRGFFSAKKRGDWRTAYGCCDYDQTLPKEERARIKKKWKEECAKWPVDYATVRWDIRPALYRGDTAFVRVVVWRRNVITGERKPAETYQEQLKRYKNKWKLTNLFVAASIE